MPMSKKTLRNAMIDRAGKRWNTAPERAFNEFQKKFGMGLVQNRSLPFTDNGQHFTFQLDFARPLDRPTGGYDVDFEIDGPHHDTLLMKQKDMWKDYVKNTAGLKVIHVPAELTKKKWWNYLNAEIAKALLSPMGSVWIAA